MARISEEEEIKRLLATMRHEMFGNLDASNKFHPDAAVNKALEILIERKKDIERRERRLAWQALLINAGKLSLFCWVAWFIIQVSNA